MIKNIDKAEEILILNHTAVFDNHVEGKPCIAKDCQIQIIDSLPFPKLLIDELGLYWQLSPERFSKSKTSQSIYNYHFAKGNYSMKLNEENSKILDKLLNLNDDMMILEEKMTQLNFTNQLFCGRGNLEKPNQKQDVQIKIVENKNKTYHIIVQSISCQITDEFDFKFNKFQNKLTWFNQQLERAYSISFQEFDSLAKIQKIILDIFNKNLQLVEVKSGSLNQSDLFADLSHQDIYQRLFFEVPSFGGNIIKQYQKRMDIESLDVGSRLPQMVTQKLNIESGGIIMSYIFSYLIAIKNQFMCIYVPSVTGITKHNQVFVANHSKYGQLTPADIYFSKDERCIVFSNKDSNQIAAYDIQNNGLLQALQIPTKKNILQLRTYDRVRFYALTESEVYEIEFQERKILLKNSRTFNKNWNLKTITVTAQGSISTGTVDGIIRLYSNLQSKKSLNNLNVAKQIIDLSFSSDHTILIATTKRKVFMFVFEKDPFVKRLSNQEKIGTYLKFNQQDRQKHKVKQFNYKKARLIIKDSYVAAWTDTLLIVWEVKKVLNNLDNSYKIIDMKQKILGFEVMSQKSLIINMEKNIQIVNLL